MTTTTPTTKAGPLAPGQVVTFQASPLASVTLHRTDNGHTGQPTYLVYVAQGAHRPDGWSHTYADETLARIEATRAARLLSRHGTADAIETRRRYLVGVVMEQERRELRRMHDVGLLRDARVELDTLLGFADLQESIALRERMNALYSHAA